MISPFAFYSYLSYTLLFEKIHKLGLCVEYSSFSCTFEVTFQGECQSHFSSGATFSPEWSEVGQKMWVIKLNSSIQLNWVAYYDSILLAEATWGWSGLNVKTELR